MPTGSRIVLRVAAEADIPTPDTDQMAFFANSDEADAPHWKDDTGTVHSLQGAEGALDGTIHGNTGATETVDWNTNVHSMVLDAATVTVSFSNVPASATPGVVCVIAIQDGTGGRDITWPAAVTWGTTGEPVWTAQAAGETTVINLLTLDGGTTVYGSVAGLPGAVDFGEDADITTLDYDDVADAGATGEVADAGHRHGMPSAGGGAAPTDTMVFLTSVVTMTNANQFYDGPTTGSLAAGEYLIGGAVTVREETGSGSMYTAQLYDGSTVLATGSGRCEAGTVEVSIAIPAIWVEPGGATTYTIRVACTGAGRQIRDTATNNGTADKASWITAIKFA